MLYIYTTLPPLYTCTEFARRSRKEAVEEILRALDRRGAEGLDELADILEMEEEQNKKILTAFRESEHHV